MCGKGGMLFLIWEAFKNFELIIYLYCKNTRSCSPPRERECKLPTVLPPMKSRVSYLAYVIFCKLAKAVLSYSLPDFFLYIFYKMESYSFSSLLIFYYSLSFFQLKIYNEHLSVSQCCLLAPSLMVNWHFTDNNSQNSVGDRSPTQTGLSSKEGIHSCVTENLR